MQVAEEKVRRFAELKELLAQHMVGINERFDAVKGIIRENVHSERNLDGLLTRDESRYIDCLQFQQGQLDEQLKQDTAHWAANQEYARIKAKEVNLKIAAVVER